MQIKENYSLMWWSRKLSLPFGVLLKQTVLQVQSQLKFFFE